MLIIILNANFHLHLYIIMVIIISQRDNKLIIPQYSNHYAMHILQFAFSANFQPNIDRGRGRNFESRFTKEKQRIIHLKQVQRVS